MSTICRTLGLRPLLSDRGGGIGLLVDSVMSSVSDPLLSYKRGEKSVNSFVVMLCAFCIAVFHVMCLSARNLTSTIIRS